MRIQLPYSSVVESFDDVNKETLNEVMRRAHRSSRSGPCYLEVHDGAEQRFLFFRGGQIYAAGHLAREHFDNTAIREFILGAGTMSFPQVVYYQVSETILHSILIMFQKEATLQVQTSLVDLDELLDKIESEGRSCVVSAVRENFLAVLRYERGAASALCQEESVSHPRESTFREEFLVKIYTITAESPVNIGVYNDLLVSYAPDAKTIPESFNGRFEELYLSKPPIVSLRFKDKEIDHWVFDKPRLRVGRTPDNDITIDNLAVSRLHAVLEEDKGEYFVRDCDSLNGTVVNGQKVGRAKLHDGDEISVGKHTLLFRVQGGQAVLEDETIQGFDQTMVISRPAGMTAGETGTPPAAPQPRSEMSEDGAVATAVARRPRLVMHTEFGDKVIELHDGITTIGKDVGADIAIEGAFVAPRHAEIVSEGGRILLRHVGGLRKVTVGGRAVREAELKDSDEIRIAKEVLIFHE